MTTVDGRNVVCCLLTWGRHQMAEITSEENDLGAFQQAVLSLSDRERQVFDLLIEGYTSKQIAERFDISVRTAEVHRGRVIGKLSIEGNVVRLARVATKAGFDIRPSAYF